MGSESLSEARKGQHLNKVSKPKILEQNVLNGFHKAVDRLCEEYGLEVEWKRELFLEDVAEKYNKMLESLPGGNPNDSLNESLEDSILVPKNFQYSLQKHLEVASESQKPKAIPDGGLCFIVLPDGRKLPWGCVEAKRQGFGNTNNGSEMLEESKGSKKKNASPEERERLMEMGLGPDGRGNALERAYKNFLLYCDYTMDQPATGYFVFCEGPAFGSRSTNQMLAPMCGYSKMNKFNVIDHGRKCASVFVKSKDEDGEWWTEDGIEGLLYDGLKRIYLKYKEIYDFGEEKH